ncbi:penicillin-binding protein 2 [Neobacillus niacini]|uniref:peptidoglycan D,D-transpeptidase FtsI family protein n=1 Tax=Neobacillus niacini TaxID=86668 RepID=UPI0021CB5ACC|nr:penicillin-binding protein 2 [Neobacillus niacini]MCM3765292.1 penicillin-binding protein 2 [Neobacillus niacini]
MNKKKKKKLVPFRLNVLFFIVFLLFSILVLRLGELQIVFGEDFKREIERTEDITVSNPVPRGKIFDTNGNIIVDNTPLNAITYTKSQNTSQEEMLKTAEKLAKIINMDTEKIPVRDKKDYWIIKHPKQAKEKITKKEWAQYEEKKLEDKDIYKLQLERVTDEELNSIQGEDLEILAIYRKFNSGYALTPQIVKNKDVTPDEFAAVSENLENLPGVDTTTDWDRLYVTGNTLRSILGDVSSSESGLPKDQLEKYLAKDYSRNDRVGKSYLELKYEDVLHGEKAKVKNITDKSGKVLSTEVISEGKRGKDLVLTIDMDLQKQVEQIIEEEMWAAKQKYPNAALLDRAFVVVMNPKTGEILSLGGRQIVKDKETGKPEMRDYAQGTFTSSYAVGSSVKGATILTGYQTGAIKPGTVLLDEPLRIASTKPKSSWKTFGSINDLRALQVSSNVYMFKTAIAMAGGHYVPNKPLPLDYTAFNTMRRYFSQFGLGVRTGIDLPNEMTGFPGADKTPGLLLDLAIGQYDTYTPLQLAQYVSTIANGGYRVQPHIVKEIREPLMENNELGPIIKELEPKVLNRIDMKDEWVKRVQEGFRMVMQVGDGTGVGHWKSAPYNPAGKTGTAQAFYDGSDKSKRMTPVTSLSLVTYAPADNPEVAMAVVVPWAYEGHSGPSINHLIGRRVLDAYFELKNSRQEPADEENAANAAEVLAADNNQ